MTDRELLQDLIGKLREMEEQLSMARLEAVGDSLLASRIRHLSILAIHVRAKLESVSTSIDLPPMADEESQRDGRT